MLFGITLKKFDYLVTIPSRILSKSVLGDFSMTRLGFEDGVFYFLLIFLSELGFTSCWLSEYSTSFRGLRDLGLLDEGRITVEDIEHVFSLKYE